jgi:hypothetical protein
MGWSWPVDKQKASARIRALLEQRICRLLGCEPCELPHMKIGSMAHFLFLLAGDAQTMPGFDTAMGALLQVLGFNLTWDVEPKEETETPTPQVVN